jgi:ribosomal-protein-alanine N-acetyltransferase
VTHVRRLTYADLPHVVAIERRAFPAPWSLAMFVLELSKPSGICLAAEDDGRLVGYLVCSSCAAAASRARCSPSCSSASATRGRR